MKEYDVKIEIANISENMLDSLMGYIKNLESKSLCNLSTYEVKELNDETRD